MYDSIRSGSTTPLFSSTMAIWRVKNGRPVSPRWAVAVPPSSAATIEAAAPRARLLHGRFEVLDHGRRPGGQAARRRADADLDGLAGGALLLGDRPQIIE